MKKFSKIYFLKIPSTIKNQFLLTLGVGWLVFCKRRRRRRSIKKKESESIKMKENAEKNGENSEIEESENMLQANREFSNT